MDAQGYACELYGSVYGIRGCLVVVQGGVATREQSVWTQCCALNRESRFFWMSTGEGSGLHR